MANARGVGREDKFSAHVDQAPGIGAAGPGVDVDRHRLAGGGVDAPELAAHRRAGAEPIATNEGSQGRGTGTQTSSPGGGIGAGIAQANLAWIGGGADLEVAEAVAFIFQGFVERGAQA